MKVPVQCPFGCGWTIEMDFTKDHQHVQCHECLSEFCAVCPSLVTINVAQRMPLPAGHPAAKARLN